MLHTTFRKLHEAGACTDRYQFLAKKLGGITKYGKDTLIPLDKLLEINGFDDALWALRALTEPSDKEVRLLACTYAEHVLHLFESRCPNDKRPRQVIETARRFALGQATQEELDTARDAARDAAYAAARDARDAAYAAAWSAASAASAAAWVAAWVAASAASAGRDAERQWQAEQLKKMLQEGKGASLF